MNKQYQIPQQEEKSEFQSHGDDPQVSAAEERQEEHIQLIQTGRTTSDGGWNSFSGPQNKRS